MSRIIEESFRVNLRVMKACHLYPPETHTRLFKILAYIMHFLLVIPVPTLGVLYVLLEDDLNMERVNYNAGFLAQTACFITKLLPFVRYGRRIKKCIHFFESPLFAVVKEEHKKIMNKCIKVCQRNTRIFLFCVAGGVTSWATKPFFWEGRNFPVDIWLPFSVTTDITIYCTLYFFIATGVYFASLATGVIDPLIAGLAYHATSQIKILKDNLQHLSEYADEEITKSGIKNQSEQEQLKSNIIYNKIQQSVNHHDAILRFVKEYEECFSSSVFSQFAASVFVICFSCLQLSKIESLGYYFVQLVMYFSVILAQIYFYCYYGSTLSEESNSLTNAIYMSNWYNFDEKSKKALIILMERSKNPILVTAGKILDLSLETFATILRRSYSLLAVLKNYQ
ncbi:unnamed protein product [Tenebrio molitor]|nr:unnamed protein product [Tenebrio molitor]